MKKLLILSVSVVLLASCTMGKTPVKTEWSKEAVNTSTQNTVIEGSIATPEKTIYDGSQVPLMNPKAISSPPNPLEIK